MIGGVSRKIVADDGSGSATIGCEGGCTVFAGGGTLYASAPSRELNGIDFNLPPSKNSVREKARILLEIIEAPSHNVSTYSLMSIAMSFATFGLGFCVGEDTESAIVTLGMTLLAILAVILIAYFIVTGFESRVRQRLVQALHVLAEAGEAGE